MPLEMSRLTREYVFWDIETPNNLSAATAEVAFMDDQAALPEVSDWEPADLIETPEGKWRFRALVGPDDVNAIDLTPPTSVAVDYQSWVRLTDNPERIVRRPGVVTIL